MVNKQGEWTMKTAIKYFWPFGHCRIRGQKLGLLLATKYIKNQSYPKMSIIKVGVPSLYSSMKKNDFENQNRAVFDL